MKSVAITDKMMDSLINGEDNMTVMTELKGVEYGIKHFISNAEMLAFVRDVSSQCFTADGEYHPELFDFLVRANTIAYYTNLELPEDTEKVYRLAILSGLYEDIIDEVEHRQYDTMIEGARLKAEHMAQQNIQAVNAELSRVTGALSTLAEQASSFAKDVNPETISSLISALDKNTADRSQLIAAYSAKAEQTREEIVADSRNIIYPAPMVIDGTKKA